MTTDYDPIAEQYKRAKLQPWPVGGVPADSLASAELSPEGEAAFGRAFWNTLLDHSPITFLECTK